MELRLIPNSTQSRFSNERRVNAGFSPARHPRRSGSSVVLRVAIEDIEGQSPDDDKSFNSANSSGVQVPRKRLEIIGGLLKERYGVGALLTAGFIKGLDLTADLMKKVPKQLSKRQRISPQRHGVLRQPRQPQNPVPGKTMSEKVQSAISNTLASPFTWSGKEAPDQELSDHHNTSTLVEEQFQNDDSVEQKALVTSSVQEQEIQDSFFKASTIDTKKEDKTTESTTAQVNSEEEKDVTEELEPPFNAEFPKESNNIETFSNTRKPSTTPFGAEISPSVAVNRAKEILDEIANFEIETGQSIDIETPQEANQIPPEKQSTSIEEIKQEMKIRSKTRLQQMKQQNHVKRTRKKPVNVVRPSKEESSRTDSRPRTYSSNTGLKGLDYINSYAKGSQGGNLYDSMRNPGGLETDSVFLGLLPAFQEGSRMQGMSEGTSSGSLQWSAMERLQKVREIRAILQLGKGDGSGGGSGWGNGGGGGSSNEDSNEDNWWIQVFYQNSKS